MFLETHAELVAARERSTVWPRIKADAAIRVADADLFVIGGDTLGGEEELFLDRLARGARLSSDAPSRELFLELSEALQALVRRELLLEGPRDRGRERDPD